MAQRSASAAKEIKALIQDSASCVHNGSQLVSAAGTTISELVKQSRHVAVSVDEIGVTTQEQEQRVLQVNKSPSSIRSHSKMRHWWKNQAALLTACVIKHIILSN